MKCCYTCANYQDALCITSEAHDDEDPDTFSCELYEWDEENEE